MQKTIAIVLIVTLGVLSTSCTFHRARIRYESLNDEMQVAEGPLEGERLGRVVHNEGGAIWTDCTRAAETSLWAVMDDARRMGGNAIGEIRWLPDNEKRATAQPTCRKAWAWLLVWPVVLTPVFMRSRVEAYAYAIGEGATPGAGVYRIPESGEQRAALVARILAETDR